MNINLPYTPTQMQSEVHADGSEFKVVVFGRRSGKSVLLLNEALTICLEKPNARVWIIAPTFGQAKDIYWRDPEMIDKYIPIELVEVKNDSELLIKFINGSILQLKGADRPETMRGVGLDFIGLDEVAEWRYAEETINSILLPTLIDRKGRAMFIGTPKGFNYFYELYLNEKTDTRWKSWRVPTWDSGAPWILTKEGIRELNDLKRESEERPYIAQEYGAEFKKYTGLVYKNFDDRIHVKDFDVPKTANIWCGMDFGYNNPTVCLFAYFDHDGRCFIFNEYYKKKENIKSHAGRIKAIRNRYPNRLELVVGDNANKQEINEYAEYDWFISPVKGTNKKILTGISKIQQRLKVDPSTDKPMLFIHPRCTNTILELERYRWKENKKPSETDDPDIPEKKHDHAMDALRYLILTYEERDEEEDDLQSIIIKKPSIYGGY